MEIKFLITITQVDGADQLKIDPRNQRNKDSLRAFVCNRYQTIKKRIKTHSTYKDLPICSRDEFLNWSLSCPSLKSLFEKWRASGHNKLLGPSIDRIDPKKGYVLSNSRWISFQENSGRARRKK